MKLIDDSPLRAGWLPWRFGPGDWRLVVAAKATFELPREGVCTLADEQAFVTGDAFWEDDPERSVRYDGDLALVKPQGEAWLTGTLRAAEPVRELACAARVGDVDMRFSVVGDRWWRPDGGMSPPEPFTEMPLAWERCFGGPGFAPNPLGRGIAPDETGRVALPNIEQSGRLIRSPNERPEPAGAWPISRAWPERARRMGRTYDAAYMRERWPYFAEDFDWRYFQAAREAQRIRGYWRGDEVIELDNLHPTERRVRCQLPGIKPRAFVHERSRPQGPLREVGLVLDTIAIDAGEGRAFVVWRGSTPCTGEAYDADFLHLYLTHEPLDAPHRESEYLHAFIGRLRALWEEQQAFEAEPLPPSDESTRVDVAPVDASPVEPPSAEDVLEAEREKARERGWPEEVIEHLYPVTPPAPRDAAAQRAELEAARGVAAELGLGEAAAVLGRALEELDLDRAPVERRRARSRLGPEPPPGLWTSQELRDIALARLAAGESLAGMTLVEADLSLLDLSGRDLSGAVLVRADLTGATLDRADLTGATLDGAKLEGATLREANLSGATLSLAEADGADFTGAVMDDAIAERAMLSGAVFRKVRGARLALEECLAVRADFTGASITEAELTRSNFDEANFRGATLTDTRIEGASLRRACLDQVDAARLRASDGTDLSEASLRWARLDGATFAQSILIGARFTESDLTRASFAEARLEGAELLAVDARGASFAGAIMSAASLAGSNLLGVRFEGTRLNLSDLSGSNLYGAELWRADVTDARLDGANVEGTKLA